MGKSSARLVGAANPNWKGGAWVTTKGYVMVLVGKEHPMANCRAYAPRCRVVCYETYGPPEPGQQARHIDGDKTNDDPSNLEWRDADNHGQIHLTPERARALGREGGHKAAANRRRREYMEMQLLAAKIVRDAKRKSEQSRNGKRPKQSKQKRGRAK